jgi:predicted nucleic acid-binding protein
VSKAPCLVFDSSPLVHFAKAGRLVVLERLGQGRRCVVPQPVLEEIALGVDRHPALGAVATLPWLERVAVDGLAELRAFIAYAEVIGTGSRDVGEASVLAWAEVHQATAIMDDQVGAMAGRARGVAVHGSLWLVFEGYNHGLVDRMGIEDLIAGLLDSGAWYPCGPQDPFEWAKSHGLLR